MLRAFSLAAAAVLMTATVASAAQRVVASATGSDFMIDAPASTKVFVPFTSPQLISGVGFTGDFRTIAGDTSGGSYPWSLDVAVNVLSPDAQNISWGAGPAFIGGAQSTGDYPYADTTAGYTHAVGTGIYTFEFYDEFNSPGVIGIDNPTYHLLAESPDVVTAAPSDVASGPQWTRPFSHHGVSGLGPVNYDVLAFRPEVSGAYSFDSFVSGNDPKGFTFLYKGAFDPADPLANLLDLGLGNGFADNGTPEGHSRIQSLLFADTDYFFVTSQWARFSGPQAYQTTITGPGALLAIPEPGVLGLLGLGALLIRRR